MAPSTAPRTAACSAAVKAAASVTVWSAGDTTRIGSAPPSRAASAASVNAGAVLRPTGSRIKAAGSTFFSRNCSSARKRCSALPTISGASTAMSGAARPIRRATACWNRLSSLPSVRNCFGNPARDKGQRRVPLPPAMMTGWIVIDAGMETLSENWAATRAWVSLRPPCGGSGACVAPAQDGALVARVRGVAVPVDAVVR